MSVAAFLVPVRMVSHAGSDSIEDGIITPGWTEDSGINDHNKSPNTSFVGKYIVGEAHEGRHGPIHIPIYDSHCHIVCWDDNGSGARLDRDSIYEYIFHEEVGINEKGATALVIELSHGIDVASSADFHADNGTEEVETIMASSSEVLMVCEGAVPSILTHDNVGVVGGLGAPTVDQNEIRPAENSMGYIHSVSKSLLSAAPTQFNTVVTGKTDSDDIDYAAVLVNSTLAVQKVGIPAGDVVVNATDSDVLHNGDTVLDCTVVGSNHSHGIDIPIKDNHSEIDPVTSNAGENGVTALAHLNTQSIKKPLAEDLTYPPQIEFTGKMGNAEIYSPQASVIGDSNIVTIERIVPDDDAHNVPAFHHLTSIIDIVDAHKALAYKAICLDEQFIEGARHQDVKGCHHIHLDDRIDLPHGACDVSLNSSIHGSNGNQAIVKDQVVVKVSHVVSQQETTVDHVDTKVVAVVVDMSEVKQVVVINVSNVTSQKAHNIISKTHNKSQVKMVVWVRASLSSYRGPVVFEVPFTKLQCFLALTIGSWGCPACDRLP